jgi:hypothetical protein
MALIRVMSEAAATKTHGVVDGTLFDAINPLSLPGDTTSALIKTGTAVLVGWVGSNYKRTGSFSL